MKSRLLKKMSHEVEDAGLKDSPLVTESAVNILKVDCDRMEEEKKFRRKHFQIKYMAWRGEAIDTIQRPVVIPEDHQDAKIYRRWAWAGLGLEILLAIWVFVTSLGLAWPIGAVSAIFAALFLHVIISVLFRNVDTPRQTIRNIKKFVLYPSLFFFAPSFSILLLSRTMTGFLSLLLLPVYGFALWATTIGLLPLVGALFATAYVLDWSYRDAQEYDRLDKEHSETLSYLKKFEAKFQQLTNYINNPHKIEEGPKGGT